MPKLKRIIAEGGGAAIALIDKKLNQQPDNEGRDLQYGKITDAELDSIFPREYGPLADVADDTYVGRIFYALGSQGLIDTSYTPSYKMGSTRLAAMKKYGQDSIDLDRYETDDVIAAVSGKKTEYGDLDIDVIFTGDKKQISAAIDAIDPATYAASGGGPKAVAVAIRIGEKVIQVDLVDVSEGRDAQNFLWKSSFVDLDKGIKGAFSIILLRAAAAAMEIGPEDTLESLVQYAEENPDSRFAQDFNKKLKLNYQPVGSRFSLGSKGLKLIVDMEKPSKKDPNKKTQAKIDFDEATRQGYEDLDELAKIILQNDKADSSTIFSASKLAEFIGKNVPRDRVNLIWSAFVDSAETTLRRGIDPNDYNTGMAYIADAMGTEWVPDAADQLNEGREAIGRFVGKNKFSNVNMFSLLRALVVETGNEGQTSFNIKLANNPAVDIVEKMDSSFSHFGINPEGEFFMETSNSGPVTKDNLEEKFGTNPEFFHDVYESFKWLQQSEEFQAALRNVYEQVGPVRYDAELFPVLTHEGDSRGNIVFVGTPYSRDKLGRVGSFVVFKAQKWSPEELSWYRPEPVENVALVNLIKKESFKTGLAENWKIYTNEEDMKHNVVLQVEFDELLADYLNSEENFERGVELLSSRKKNPDKDELLFSLNRVREVLQDKLNTYASNAKSVLGDENSYIEGVVLRVKRSNGDIFEAKGTSYKFDEHKEELWSDRVNVMNVYKNFEKALLLDVLELRTDHPATLNKAIKQVSDDFTPSASGDEGKVQFIQELLPVITDKKNGFNKVKTQAISLLRETESQFEQVSAQFENNKSNLDPDTIRKTQALYDATAEKLKTFEKSVVSSLESMSYYVYLLGIALGRRIDRFVNFGRTEPRKKKQDRPKVIFWNGRAQPWHKGHDAMVQKGKGMLDALGAEAVMIMIVKGGKSSQDKSTNPLSEAEQIKLISSVYKNDPQVIVSDKVLKRSFIGEIANVVYSTGKEVVGWLAGADRIDSYRRGLKSFNPEMWEKDHAYSPFDADDMGQSTVKMIETPRVMSGTKARELAQEVDVEQWIQAVAPEGIDSEAIAAYSEVYERLRNPDLSEIVFDQIMEMSAMAGGAAAGYAGKDAHPDAEDGTLIREEENNNTFILKQGETLYHGGRPISDQKVAWFSNSAELASSFGDVQTYVVKKPISLYIVGSGNENIDEDDDNYEIALAACNAGWNGYFNDFEYGPKKWDVGICNPSYFFEQHGVKENLPAFVAGGSMGAKRDDDKLVNPEDKNMEREQFMQEMMLRKYIRRAINIVEKRNQKQVELQESKIRRFVLKLIAEAEEDHPHDNTGINVLQDLLKKIIPVFEKDYKSLTTDQTQRQSFRAHIVNAVQNSLAPSRAEISIEEPGSEGAPMQGLGEQEGEEEVTSRDLDPKFIDIEPEKKQQQEIPPEEQFGIPGEDETGRNVAMKSWDQVETAVVDSYQVLSNPQDRELFYDYLITNLKLYFDKFEEELAAGVQEPESEIYQQQKSASEQPVSDELGI